MTVVRIAAVVVLAVALPAGQLRAAAVIADRCCCPDPARCHCPPHKTPRNDLPTLDHCGKTAHVVIKPTLQAFVAPPASIAMAIVSRPAAPHMHPAPHAPPDPDRPAAPS